MENTTLTLLFAILTCLSARSQNVLVEYENKISWCVIGGKLVINDTISLYTYKPYEKSTVGDEEHKNREAFVLKSDQKGVALHNYYGPKFNVRDSLHTMKWELNNNTKVILEEKCLSATTTFRGRKYIAYYATSLPYSNGPWKFGGLPGLILEVVSEEGNYYFKATKIVKNYKEKINTKKMYSYKYIGWTEYKKEFVEHTNRKLKEMSSSTSGEGQGRLKVDMIEIIYPKLQTGKGIEF
jgi:GLPGLI family protein